MKLSAVLAPLIAAKVPHDVILQTVLAYEAEQADALERRRQSDAARQARKRERDDQKSRDVTLRHSDRSLVRDRVAPVEDKTLTSEIEPQEKKVRACRLPTDFVPDVSWAASQGLSQPQAQTEAAKFRDYWSSKGANATKTDWPATWRNWVRSAVERIPQNRAPPKPQTTADVARNLLHRMETAHADPTAEIEGNHPLALGFPGRINH